MAKKLQSLPEPTEGSFDRTDLELLRILRKDSRTTLQDIAVQVGVSPTTCWTRIKRLEASGVIRCYTIDIDESLLGYHDTVFAHVTLSKHNRAGIDAFEKAMLERPEVLDVYSMTGDADYLVRVVARSTREYERFLNEAVFSNVAVQQIKSNFALREIKSTVAIPVPED